MMNIWCVGRNYQDHAKEMNSEIPSEPMFFLKSGDCLEVGSQQIILPPWSTEIHHEVELMVLLNEHLLPTAAAVALDLTARDKQAIAKTKGHPWTLAKSFTGSCPSSRFMPIITPDDLKDLRLRLSINGVIKQEAPISDMIFDIPSLTSHLKAHFPVKKGDLILTGTPAGVGPLNPGDIVTAEIVDKISHQWSCIQPHSP